MIQKRIISVVISMVIVFSSLGSGLTMILELRDVTHFSAIEIPGNALTTLRLQGLTFHSSLAVGRVDTYVDGKALVVEICLTVARPGLSGRFDYTLTIPEGVDHVLFGRERVSVWPLRAPERPKGD